MTAAARRVYFNEYNVAMGRTTYLPLVSGLLRAFAETAPNIKAAYDFKPFIFSMDTTDAILVRYDEEPHLAAFSVSMWNEQLSLHVAKKVKERWPDCLIVFGGAQLPHYPEDYFKRYPFIDVGIRAEGEEAFAGVLERFLTGRDFSAIPNVSFRDPETGQFRHNPETPEFERDLDIYSSPYLSGLFDDLFLDHKDLEFQAIIETNRGCPFLCTFCYWGKGGTSRKYRYHSLERVKAEIDWCGRHNIRYVFNADSNFGMHKRDAEIAEYLIEAKKTYGYPEKFRTCWGKNTDENIFKIAGRLHQYGLEKSITLARQSNTKQVLANIKRGNIKLEGFASLQRRFNDLDVPVYTEMILGLPGETYESWRNGLEEILSAGLKNQIFVYQCEVYPNTEMADPGYQKKFGIKTRRTELREIHGSIRDQSWAPEYQDIVIETATMPTDDWRRMTRLGVMTMLLHSLKAGFFILTYLANRFSLPYTAFIEFICDRKMAAETGSMIRAELDRLDSYMDGLLEGLGRGVEMREFGAIYWDAEEAHFLSISNDFLRFYREMEKLVGEFLKAQSIGPDADELAEVILYQQLRMQPFSPPPSGGWTFRRNLPEYFDRLLGNAPVDIAAAPQRLRCDYRDFGGDKESFARETVLWGRKSGTILASARWESADAPVKTA